jgi:hypothetical protein
MASRLRSNSARVEASPARRPTLTVAWRAGSRVNAHPAVEIDDAVEADAVFKALDGLELVSDSSACVRVYSIFDQGDNRWIQYSLESGCVFGTLRMSIADSPEQVIRTLQSWVVDRTTASASMDSSVVWTTSTDVVH